MLRETLEDTRRSLLCRKYMSIVPNTQDKAQRFMAV